MKPNFSGKIHFGHNIRCLRYILGIKQNTIADAMDTTQQNFSILEQKADIDNVLLEKIASIMKIPVDVIRNFSEDDVINFISGKNLITSVLQRIIRQKKSLIYWKNVCKIKTMKSLC